MIPMIDIVAIVKAHLGVENALVPFEVVIDLFVPNLRELTRSSEFVQLLSDINTVSNWKKEESVSFPLRYVRESLLYPCQDTIE